MILLAVGFIPLIKLNKRLAIRTRTIYTIILYMILIILVFLIYHQTFCSRYTDTERMYSEMERASYIGPSYLFESYDLNPLSAVYLFLINLTGDKYMLKAFCAIIYFGAILFTAFNIRFKYSPIVVFLGTIYLLAFLDLSYPADTIRFPMASMIFCMTLLNHYFSSIKLPVVHTLCIISCLIHFSLWPFYLLFVFRKIVCKRYIFGVISICTLFYYLLILNSASLISSVNPSLGYKLEMYFFPDNQYYKSTISFSQILFLSSGLLFSVALFYLWNRNFHNLFNSKKNIYKKLFIIYVCLVAGSFPSNVSFSRLIPIVFVLSSVFLLDLLSYYFDHRYMTDKQCIYFPVISRVYHLYFLIFILFVVASFILRCIYSYAPFYITV